MKQLEANYPLAAHSTSQQGPMPVPRQMTQGAIDAASAARHTRHDALEA